MEKQLIYTTPESVGISSAAIERYLRSLEDMHLSSHDVIIERGGKVCFEQYWAPFKAEDEHRMYSVTKSFVALGIGFLLQEGQIASLDDPILRYFPEYEDRLGDEALRELTIRQMLTMSTARPGPNMFITPTDDRLEQYFTDPNPSNRHPGAFFQYDSSGSFVMGSLIEKLSGMRLVDYLKAKFLDRIGVSDKVRCLDCPGGHSWGDSALLCQPRDLLKTARFLLNGGRVDGEQLLDPAYIHAATTKQVDNCIWSVLDYQSFGYGYQFWITFDGAFFFHGMGGQLGVCVPSKDMILIYNGDNQGFDERAKQRIIESFFREIVWPCADSPLPEDAAAKASLAEYRKGLKLSVALGAPSSPLQEKVRGVTYKLRKNPMGITQVSFTFDENGGTLHYVNAQGEKDLAFGLGENRFGPFPQTGYSKEVCGRCSPGHTYRCAASAAWVEPAKLFLNVQIIDDYFGRLYAFFTFSSPDASGTPTRISLDFHKVAEDFLKEYSGMAKGEI